MWVFDATPLIYLATVDHLTLLEHYEEPRVIPERVYEEVVETGLDAGYPDARRIERAVAAEQFTVITVDTTPLLSRLQTNEHLSDADCAVLACADERDGIAVIDEQYGRDVAAAEGITTRGTAYLVLNLVKDGTLSVDDARTAIDAMIDAGWYCAPDVYATITRKLDGFSE
ncbi:DUF3368 domain-containing protein [Halovivax limisalsi]|uniref:DUF3368 domain-containing protein n=1 Tax=Halovivax limisalsi TaxID=1453760 RepID=UPI001FFC709A|nr:DUF3368 domain-containing protein [Halovivax limisalsi]